MARQIKITVTTATNTVTIQDYNSSTSINNMLSCGMGEFTMEQSGHTDLTNAAAKVTFVHRDGARFGEALIGDIESVTINGVAATITNLSLVRDAVAPYFFSLGGGGEFTYYTEVTLTPTILLNQIASPGYIILPAVAGAYYDFKINWEYTRGTTSYSTGSSAISFDMLDTATPRQCCLINGLNLSFASDRVCPNIRPTIVTTTMNPFPVGSAIYMRLASNANATLGDGTVLLKIWYNLITF